MKRLALGCAALFAAASLAACGKEEGAPQPPTAGASASSPSSQMSNMATPGAIKTGKGTGTVMGVDPVAGTITLSHGPVPELNWPPMTMAFKTAPTVIKKVKQGDHVGFDVRLQDGAAEVTGIRKQ